MAPGILNWQDSATTRGAPFVELRKGSAIASRLVPTCVRWSCDSRNPIANGEVDQIPQRVEIQLFHETGSMSFHRPNANSQSGGDLFIGFAFDQQLQDLQLSGCEDGPKVYYVSARSVLDQCA